jgi:threonine/homoserine/homoserine lactone efflux protein
VPEPSVLAVFCLAALALLIIPGPSVLYIVTRSMDQGRMAGVASVLGVHTGTLVHIAAAAAGLSALLISSAVAFNVVRFAGAAYLIYIGLRRILGKDETVETESVAPRKLSRIYYQGVVVNVLNPKTALFFFAFLPQFVEPDKGSAWLQIVVLGLVFIAVGIVSDGTYALAASTLANKLKTSKHWHRFQRYFAGGTLIALGVTAAVSGSRPSTT